MKKFSKPLIISNFLGVVEKNIDSCQFGLMKCWGCWIYFLYLCDNLTIIMEKKKKIVFLTGAGISAESGISTFRDSDGLWENHRVEDVASIEGWWRNPELMLDFYNERRRGLGQCVPNSAHKAIAMLEEWYDVVVVTQNVDDLHERGGSSNVIHLHGELCKVCSSLDKESHICSVPYDHAVRMGDLAPDGSQLRPYIVWFGEAVPMIERAFEEVASADIFVVVGTSLQVQPAASLVTVSRAERNFIIDPNIPKIALGDAGIEVIQAKATEGMRRLVEILNTDN